MPPRKRTLTRLQRARAARVWARAHRAAIAALGRQMRSTELHWRPAEAHETLEPSASASGYAQFTDRSGVRYTLTLTAVRLQPEDLGESEGERFGDDDGPGPS